MNLATFSFVIFAFFIRTEGAEVESRECQIFTHYNALCTHDGVAFIITSHPCKTSFDFTITIIQPLNNTYETHSVNRNGTFIIGNRLRAVFTVEFLTEGEYSGDSVTSLHIYNLWTNVLEAKYKEFFFTADNGPHLCEAFLPGRTSFDSRRCVKTFELDKYGTACLYEIHRGDGMYGIYTAMFDPCTVPYHVTIGVYIPALNQTVVRYYTGSKTDHIVKVHGFSGCGFTMDYGAQPNSGGEKQSIKVYNTCPGRLSAKETMIEALYQPHDGLLCHPSDCYAISPTHLNCSTEIVGPFANQSLLWFDLEADLCHDPKIHVAISMPGRKDTVNITLTGPDDTTPFVFDNHHVPNNVTVAVTNGFISNEGGTLSFQIDEIEEENEIELSLFRHYPTEHDHIPLIHAIFSSSTEHCDSQKGKQSDDNDDAIIIGSVVLIAVIICIVAAVLVYFYHRRKMRTQVFSPQEFHKNTPPAPGAEKL